jgi:hypothetical protein
LRILFLVHNLGKTRHFEGVIRGLAARGHTVAVAAARKRKPLRPTKALHDEPRVEVITCPTRRVDRWADVATPLRSARDSSTRATSARPSWPPAPRSTRRPACP